MASWKGPGAAGGAAALMAPSRAAERDPALIGRDLEYGYITEQAAREAFGLACPP